MTKAETLKMIDGHRNKLVDADTIEMQKWTWLRAIVLQIPEEQFEEYVTEAMEEMSR